MEKKIGWDKDHFLNVTNYYNEINSIQFKLFIKIVIMFYKYIVMNKESAHHEKSICMIYLIVCFQIAFIISKNFLHSKNT